MAEIKHPMNDKCKPLAPTQSDAACEGLKKPMKCFLTGTDFYHTLFFGLQVIMQIILAGASRRPICQSSPGAVLSLHHLNLTPGTSLHVAWW